MVSNIFYFHPYLGKIPILTHVFQMGWFNHQLAYIEHLGFVMTFIFPSARRKAWSTERRSVFSSLRDFDFSWWQRIRWVPFDVCSVQRVGRFNAGCFWLHEITDLFSSFFVVGLAGFISKKMFHFCVVTSDIPMFFSSEFWICQS